MSDPTTVSAETPLDLDRLQSEVVALRQRAEGHDRWIAERCFGLIQETRRLRSRLGAERAATVPSDSDEGSRPATSLLARNAVIEAVEQNPSAPAPTSAETLDDRSADEKFLDALVPLVAGYFRDRGPIWTGESSRGSIGAEASYWTSDAQEMVGEIGRDVTDALRDYAARSLVEQARGSGVAILDGEDVKMLRAASLHFLDVYLHNGSLVAQYRAARADRLIALAARGSIAAPVQAPPTTDEIAQVIYASDIWPESSTWEHASALNRTRCLEAAKRVRAALIAPPSEGDHD